MADPLTRLNDLLDVLAAIQERRYRDGGRAVRLARQAVVDYVESLLTGGAKAAEAQPAPHDLRLRTAELVRLAGDLATHHIAIGRSATVEDGRKILVRGRTWDRFYGIALELQGEAQPAPSGEEGDA